MRLVLPCNVVSTILQYSSNMKQVAFCGRPSVRSLALVPLILSIVCHVLCCIFALVLLTFLGRQLFNLLGTLLFLLIPNALSSDAVCSPHILLFASH